MNKPSWVLFWWYFLYSFCVIFAHSWVNGCCGCGPTLCLFTAVQVGNVWGLHYITPVNVFQIIIIQRQEIYSLQCLSVIWLHKAEIVARSDWMFFLVLSNGQLTSDSASPLYGPNLQQQYTEASWKSVVVLFRGNVLGMVFILRSTVTDNMR